MANFQPNGIFTSFQKQTSDQQDLQKMYDDMLRTQMENLQKQLKKQQEQMDNVEIDKNEDKFETDAEGKILLKEYQCHQCLKLCKFDVVLKSHLEYCDQFSCHYLECRDDTYSVLYVSKQFKNKEDLNVHIKEKHHKIHKSFGNNFREDQNKFTDKFTDDQNKFADYIDKFNSEEKSKTKEILDEKTLQQNAKIEKLEK